jgi:peptidoglycan/LPS O-acetylase OafA/YrhL
MFNSSKPINGVSSMFLDALRFCAAVCVFLTHAKAIWYPETENDALSSNLSHGAVVVFFVLSGFVIAHTTTKNHRSPKEYIIARLSRLYSIFFPAIIITIICALILKWQAPKVYQSYDQAKIVFKYISSMFFCNEIWFFSSAPVINGPIWSLSYEFWYYAIFGAFYYKKPKLRGYILPLIVCFIAGPKILLMMFMWLLGWLVYHLPTPKLNKTLAWLLVFVLLTGAVLTIIYLPSIPNQVNTSKLHWADKFISDWVVSLFVSACLYIMPLYNADTKVSVAGINFFRRLGDLTFPIYVLHFPFLIIVNAILAQLFKYDTLGRFALGSAIGFALCSLVGVYLESKRRLWNGFFKSIIYKLT